MLYNFATDSEPEAIGALIVYAIYRSRDRNRFKVTPDMWGVIERAVKSTAKRAVDLGDFIERLKPRLACSSIKPQFMRTHLDETITMVRTDTGELVQIEGDERREFLVNVLERADHRATLEVLYKKAALVILLVRERIEREKPIEPIIEKEEENEVIPA